MIVKYPNEILRKKCQRVKKLNKIVIETIDLLKKNLLKSLIGVGLSAPQIGKDLRIFIINIPNQPKLRVFINPEVVDTFNGEKTYPMILNNEKEENFLEGCLSFPNIYGTVKRWLEIKVEYFNETLEKRKEVLSCFEAIVFQHELDHLDGKLFVDHVKEESGKLYKERDGKLERIYDI